MIIGIIGGGASGMAAAISASECPENRVLLFERQARVGRKLQATGNGRCNLSNRNASAGAYHGDWPDFVIPALKAYPVERTLQWFRELGLYTVTETSGRVYPYSDQANSVVDVLRFRLERENVQVLTGCEVDKIRKKDGGFSVAVGSEEYFCHRLIIACGGLAGTKLGGSMMGYKLLRSMGHRCTRLRPTLVQIKSNWKGCVSLKGVRCCSHVQIFCDDAMQHQSTGELQFTEYGLSGPVIFEVSRDVCAKAGTWYAKLDFLPEEPEQALLEEFQRRCKTVKRTEDLLTGMLHNRLGKVLLQNAGISLNTSPTTLTDEDRNEICRVIKALEVPLTEPLGMDSAQVTAGGILTEEFDPATMESRLVPGLYACGEVLDIDGDCGGYNLQWAWSSGLLAGAQAGGTKI